MWNCYYSCTIFYVEKGLHSLRGSVLNKTPKRDIPLIALCWIQTITYRSGLVAYIDGVDGVYFPSLTNFLNTFSVAYDHDQIDFQRESFFWYYLDHHR